MVTGPETGVVNAANSLAALEEILFNKKLITPEELKKALDSNFEGQTFETSCFRKLELLQTVMEDMGISLPVLVDGGVNLRNAGRLASCGATCAVAGTAVFGQEDIGSAVKAFREIGPVEDMISEEMSSIEIEKVG